MLQQCNRCSLRWLIIMGRDGSSLWVLLLWIVAVYSCKQTQDSCCALNYGSWGISSTAGRQGRLHAPAPVKARVSCAFQLRYPSKWIIHLLGIPCSAGRRAHLAHLAVQLVCCNSTDTRSRRRRSREITSVSDWLTRCPAHKTELAALIAAQLNDPILEVSRATSLSFLLWHTILVVCLIGYSAEQNNARTTS